MHKIFSFIILFLLITNLSFSQNQTDQDFINKQFDLALNLYNNQQYDKALKIFNQITDNFEYNSKTSASEIFIGKILVQQKKYDEAENDIKDFLSQNPDSRYSDEARVTIAKAFIEQSKYLDAFKELTFILETSNSQYYLLYAKNTAEKLARDFLRAGEVQNLFDSFTKAQPKSFILLTSGKLYLKEGDKVDASKVFSKIVKQFPNSEEYKEADNLLKSNLSEITPEVNNNLIGVMLPLFNSLDSNRAFTPAGEILEGIKFAISEYNKDRQDKIGLIIRNTNNDTTKILRIKNEFVSIPSIKAIIGPLFSNEVRVALEDFKDSDIPVISPTATDDGLINLYNNFFQANPSFDMRGLVMAQYVYYVENKRRMAVLNAMDGYSSLLANSFVNEFQKLGGEIIVRQSYITNSFDLTDQVNQILAVADTLQGIYVPLADKMDAPVILSSLVKDSLYLPLYGNQDWFLAKGYETSPELSNQLTFTSDFFIDYNSPNFKSFSSDFYSQTKKDANRNVLYGYDTAKYLLGIIRNVQNNRYAIEMKMESGFSSSGLHNNIAFDSRRINRFLNIVRYKEGIFELVDKFESGQ